MGIQLNENGKLDAIAFPGGYSIRYLCADGETVCADCANSTVSDSDAWEGDRPETPYIYWEGATFQCARCQEDIASEYGDPEAPETESGYTPCRCRDCFETVEMREPMGDQFS